MPISYPLALPSAPNFRSANIRLRRATAVSSSPFSYSQQVFSHPGARWEAECTLPMMSRSTAAAWRSFFFALQGQRGTFLMGEPLATAPLGTATAASISVNANQRDTTVTVNGMGAGTTLLAGDVFSIDNHLHQLVEDATADGSGIATLTFEPGLRLAVSAPRSLTLTNPLGIWRMASNELEWSIDKMSHYGISFSCVEAL